MAEHSKKVTFYTIGLIPKVRLLKLFLRSDRLNHPLMHGSMGHRYWQVLVGGIAPMLLGEIDAPKYRSWQSVSGSMAMSIAWLKIVKLLQSPRKRVRREQKCHNKIWGKDLRKRNVLSGWRKIVNEGDDWMSSASSGSTDLDGSCGSWSASGPRWGKAPESNYRL